jgi:hypothetical protein
MPQGGFMSQPSRPQRKGTRFPPDPNTVLMLKSSEGDGQQLVGLVIDESYEGCSAVVRETPALRDGARFVCAIGSLAPVDGSVAWTRLLEPGIVRVGMTFAIERPSRKKQ